MTGVSEDRFVLIASAESAFDPYADRVAALKTARRPARMTFR